MDKAERLKYEENVMRKGEKDEREINEKEERGKVGKEETKYEINVDRERGVVEGKEKEERRREKIN
jgi:hypothetical protein